MSSTTRRVRAAAALGLSVPLFVACGGGATKVPETASPSPPASAPAPVETSAAPEAPPAESVASAPAAEFPKTCAGETKEPCVPPGDFVKKICDKPIGDVALALFRKSSPFTRGYLTREVDGWNASGGGSSREKVPFDEEVLVLRAKVPPKGGMQMSGQGGFDVLRWDGSCISLAPEEMSSKRPPRPRAAPIPFRYLSEKTQLALLANDKIKTTYEARRKECKGVTTGEVSAKCEKLDKELSVVIVDFVRNGGEVPEPK
jgi:hypothetical protein